MSNTKKGKMLCEIVYTCCGCDHCSLPTEVRYGDPEAYTCGMTGRGMSDILAPSGIPEWCPLPNEGLETLLSVRINGIKHVVCKRMDNLESVVQEAGNALVKTLGDADDMGQIGQVDSYVHKLVDSELLLEIGRLKAYVEIYRELTGRDYP